MSTILDCDMTSCHKCDAVKSCRQLARHNAETSIIRKVQSTFGIGVRP